MKQVTRESKDLNYREGEEKEHELAPLGTCKMPQIEQQQLGRVHHRNLGSDYFNSSSSSSAAAVDNKRDDKISYSAIVNKSIMNKLAWAKTSASSSLMTTATKAQHNSSGNQGQPEDRQFSQAMYRMTSMQLHSNRRYTSPHPHQNFSRHSQSHSTSGNRNYHTSGRSSNKSNYKLMTPSLMALILASSLILVVSFNDRAAFAAEDQAAAAATSASNSNRDEREKAGATAAIGDTGTSNNRRDSSDYSASSSSYEEKNSIVASLSSAVASAAAAAAVAAAKNSLSSGDARSLLSSSGSSSPSGYPKAAHQQRSPGALNFALKLADTIPEVPYSILHNMKKLDHAAPFYNVPGKLSTSSTGTSGKESAHSFLLSALTSPAGLSHAADQLSALFRSPLWKRIADGYGEFTSEFRSLFRAKPTTMKGPSSSSTKLLRDISVPAALMLLASAIPSDWRPNMKNRRKSSPLEPALPPLGELTKFSSGTGDQMDSSASSESIIRNYLQPAAAAAMPSQQFFPRPQDLAAQSPFLSSYSNPSTLIPRPFAGLYDQQQQQLAMSGQQQQVARAIGGADINMQPERNPSESVGGATGNWMSLSSKLASISPAAGQQQQQMPQEQQMPVKRVGESVLLYSDSSNGAKYQQTNLKPVDHHNIAKVSSSSNSPTPAAAGSVSGASASSELAEARDESGASGKSLFGSLTSNLARINPAKLLMNKLMNANSNGVENHHYQMMMALPSEDGHEERSSSLSGLFSALVPRRDHHQLLSDKHRYSLVEATDSSSSNNNGNMNAPQPTLSRSSSSASATVSSSSSSSASSRPTFSLSSSLSKAAMRILSPNDESGSSGFSWASDKLGGFVKRGDSSQSSAVAASSFYKPSLSTMMIGGDKTIHLREQPSAGLILQRRNSLGAGGNGQVGQQEQRDLTQLLPQSWREVVKRTMNSVKQEASTQWRSIEGQLTNWVQDKLKTLPMTSSQPAAPAAGASPAPAASQPVTNLIASVSSTAMNMLGLGGRTAAPKGSSNSSDSSSSSSGGDLAQATSSGSSTKVDSPTNNNKASSASSLKTSALAGVANMIVNTLTNRQPATLTSQKPANTAEDSSSSPGSASGASIVSQYPTLTGAQPQTSNSQQQQSSTSR